MGSRIAPSKGLRLGALPVADGAPAKPECRSAPASHPGGRGHSRWPHAAGLQGLDGRGDRGGGALGRWLFPPAHDHAHARAEEQQQQQCGEEDKKKGEHGQQQPTSAAGARLPSWLGGGLATPRERAALLHACALQEGEAEAGAEAAAVEGGGTVDERKGRMCYCPH
jgi:hypothetical protein